MIITYQRPDTLDAHQVDQDAPDADLSPTGATCGTATVDVLGIPWSCSRAPHPGQDEHRATVTAADSGPTGAVAIAWTYQYATDEQHGDVDHAAPTQSITITLSFPDRAARGIDAAAMIRSMIDAGLGHFWEGDQDDVTAHQPPRRNRRADPHGLGREGDDPPHTPPGEAGTEAGSTRTGCAG